MTDLEKKKSTTRGTLGIGEGGDFRIRFERTLQHPPERVWQWIVDGAKRERWLPGCESLLTKGFGCPDRGQRSGQSGNYWAISPTHRTDS